jgi:UDP-3-O-acyl N-acetylglucosamine deacetylase
LNNADAVHLFAKERHLNHHPRPQATISRNAHVSGFGYWSGQDVNVEFKPAPADSGIVFVRSDIGQRPRIPASIYNRIEGPRRTTLVRDGIAVDMVEHVMAALAGLRIDNCEVWVNGQELPGCDGSSQPFVQALNMAGRTEQTTPRPVLQVPAIIRVGDQHSWLQAEPSPTGRFELTYHLHYEQPNPLGRQHFRAIIDPQTFCQQIAPARTFLMKSEADWIRAQGLGRRVRYQDLLVFDDQGPVENELRFDNECARHKVLDLLGDLALFAADFIGKFTGCRSGHRLNAKMVRELMQHSNLNTRTGEFLRPRTIYLNPFRKTA